MTSAAKFNAEVKAWFDVNVVKNPLEVQRIAALEALTQAVQSTPVGNEKNWKIALRRPDYRRKNYVGGHARRNWQLNFGSPLRQEIPGVDRNGTQAIREGMRVTRGITRLGITYLTNNVPYIEVIDQGKPGTQPRYTPWSKQAPEGLLEPIIRGVLQRLGEITKQRDIRL